MGVPPLKIATKLNLSKKDEVFFLQHLPKLGGGGRSESFFLGERDFWGKVQSNGFFRGDFGSIENMDVTVVCFPFAILTSVSFCPLLK